MTSHKGGEAATFSKIKEFLATAEPADQLASLETESAQAVILALAAQLVVDLAAADFHETGRLRRWWRTRGPRHALTHHLPSCLYLLTQTDPAEIDDQLLGLAERYTRSQDLQTIRRSRGPEGLLPPESLPDAAGSE